MSGFRVFVSSVFSEEEDVGEDGEGVEEGDDGDFAEDLADDGGMGGEGGVDPYEGQEICRRRAGDGGLGLAHGFGFVGVGQFIGGFEAGGVEEGGAFVLDGRSGFKAGGL